MTLAPGQTQTLYFYVAAAGTEDALNAAIAKVTNASGDHWMETTRSAYAAWLAEGRTPELGEDKLNDAYKSISVFMKQSIVPGTNADGNVRFAAFPATTNPSAYSYKVWARDSAVTAMGLDATGHLREAENYWTWLADRQITTDEGSWKKPGTFWTCYWVWDNGPVSFVEPEFDSIGMFLVGAYRHYEQLTGSAKTAFLEKIWPAYRRSADYVLNNITDAGFGPADCSIWEEQNEYNAFTQALYVAGLDAAQHMAAAKGLQDVADLYNGGASTIRTAILRDDTASPKGLWNTESQRFNRAVNLDGTANTTYDSSSDVLISYGVVDAESSRAKSHIDGILENLGHDTYGVARYENDGLLSPDVLGPRRKRSLRGRTLLASDGHVDCHVRAAIRLQGLPDQCLPAAPMVRGPDGRGLYAPGRVLLQYHPQAPPEYHVRAHHRGGVPDGGAGL